jgi:hypothetical protein
MGKSVTRKDVLLAGSQWLMKGVEKSWQIGKERLIGTRGLRSFIHKERGFTTTRSSVEVRQEKPQAEAACGAFARGGAEDMRAWNPPSRLGW